MSLRISRSLFSFKVIGTRSHQQKCGSALVVLPLFVVSCLWSVFAVSVCDQYLWSVVCGQLFVVSVYGQLFAVSCSWSAFAVSVCGQLFVVSVCCQCMWSVFVVSVHGQC